MRKMKCKRCVFSVYVLLVGFFCGCNQGSGQVNHLTESMESGEIAQAESAVEMREPIDCLTQEWQIGEDIENTEKWWSVVGYKKDLIQHPESLEQYDLSYRSADESDYYILAKYNTDYYLNHIDGNNLEVTRTKLSVELPEKGTMIVTGMEAVKGDVNLFIQQWDEEKKDTKHYYVAKVASDGKVELQVDILPAIEQAGMKPQGTLMLNGVKGDSRGLFYVRNNSQAEVAVIDETGALLHIMEHPDGSRNIVSSNCKTPEGIRIFESANLQTGVNTFYYYDGTGTKVLCEGDYEIINARCMNVYGDIFYPNQGNLIRWDMVQGKQERIYMESGDEFQNCQTMLCNDAGNILLFFNESGVEYVYEFSKEELQNEVTITMLSQNMADYYIRSYAANFSREHPGVNIKIEEPDEGDVDETWNRAMADLMAGQGPDMFLIDREKMLLLQEKGVLADLSKTLPREVMEQIFTGVLQEGMTDDKLYSIIYSANTSTLMVSKSVWSEETWSTEDVLQIIKERERTGNPVTTFVADAYGASSESMLNSLALKSLEYSSFLDMEAGKCYFNTDEFCDLLEICKKYGVESERPSNINGDDLFEKETEIVKSGEALAFHELILNMLSFGRDLSALGEEYHCVGYPTKEQSGSYWNCYNGIAVNAKTEHTELIKEFLQYVMSEENQRENSGIVRKDVIRNNIIHADWNVTPQFYTGNRTYYDLETKSDGTLYLEDYIAYLDSCVATPTKADPIRTIILEEAEAYFNGDKDVQTVTDIIQKRAQLYLNENR